ncbi:MAG: NitT/TauT family transport system permease protein [Alphaproteobacteria bacterium]|jgi:NitT/TauT family transport system permease protein|nr:NitT/TauT family transport system permease protein [Alphaproteobacteria bacterium]
MPSRGIRIRLGQFALVLAFVLALEWLVATGTVSELLLSRPSQVAIRLWQDIASDELGRAVATTVREVLIALVLTLLIGFALGLAFHRFAPLRAAAEPMLVAFYSAPAILLYPIFLTFLGQGSATVITMAVILGSTPIAINMAAGFSGIEPIWRKVGRSLNATPSQMLTRILIPAATPILVAGFRLGLTFALIGVIALEFLTYSGGLGRLISWRYYIFDTDGVYAGIVLVALIAIAINSLLTGLERRIRGRWT